MHCRRGVLYPGAGELRERRVGVLAAVQAARLPQGLQAGRPAAQALLAPNRNRTAHDQQLCPCCGQRAAVGGEQPLRQHSLCARGHCEPGGHIHGVLHGGLHLTVSPYGGAGAPAAFPEHHMGKEKEPLFLFLPL